jgi:hypothetical protein
MRRIDAKHCVSTTCHPVSRGGKHLKPVSKMFTTLK